MKPQPLRRVLSAASRVDGPSVTSLREMSYTASQKWFDAVGENIDPENTSVRGGHRLIGEPSRVTPDLDTLSPGIWRVACAEYSLRGNLLLRQEPRLRSAVKY
jgi:hypothetical protein